MKPQYKKVKTLKPHCTICGELLKGNGSIVLPYNCSYGEWEWEWHSTENQISELKLKQIGCDFCGDKDKEVFTSEHDEVVDCEKSNIQICVDCVKQLFKLIKLTCPHKTRSQIIIKLRNKYMKKPKYKIGDTVISKGWIYYNLFEITGGYWNEDLQEWRYILSKRNAGWFSIRYCKNENEIRETDLKWN